MSYLLSHQAGLAWVDGAMTPDEALAWDPVIDALEAQVPAWEPGRSTATTRRRTDSSSAK